MKKAWSILFGLLLFSWICYSPVEGVNLGDQVEQGDEGRLGFAHIPLGPSSAAGVTVSGVSQFNTSLTGVSQAARPMGAGITVWISPPTKGSESMFFFNKENTAISGNTLYIHLLNPGTGVTNFSNTACTPGVSKYTLAGDVLANTLIIFATGETVWGTKTAGSVPVEAN